ncbi:MAG: MBL fold metallo-hydrolase [Microscillaceae bacterium]
MKVQLIRNATLKVQYAGQTLLIDPMFSPKFTFDPFAGKSRNPTTNLPLSVEDILQDVDAVLVTHTHPDHFDALAIEKIDKHLPLFCQPADVEFMHQQGFKNVKVVDDKAEWNDIQLYRTHGFHGSGEVLKHMGTVSGFVLRTDREPTLYIVGDCIWTEEISNQIDEYKPAVIIANTGGAILPTFADTPILMDEQQAISLIQYTEAKVIAVHMESLDHCETSREGLKRALKKNNISEERVYIPPDGEIIVLE